MAAFFKYLPASSKCGDHLSEVLVSEVRRNLLIVMHVLIILEFFLKKLWVNLLTEAKVEDI